MVQIKWTEKASKHLHDIYTYISQDSSIYAENFIKELISSCKILETHPHSGRIVPEFENINLREIIYRNYRIIYRTQNTDIIEILAVYHGARDFTNIKL